MNFNVYVDGSWLFKQCAAEAILASRTETPDSPVRLDFVKFVNLLMGKTREFIESEDAEAGNLYFCMSIFDIPQEAVSEGWEGLDTLSNNVYAREQFARSATDAGFSEDGLLRVPLRRWVIPAIRRRTYRERQVDTWIVAQLVEQAINHPGYMHFLVSGDVDMMPGVRKVVPDYSEKVVMVATHPMQFNPEQQQTSFAIESFEFRYGPIHLEQELESIIEGEHVYRCSNPSCNRVFVRYSRIPRGANPLCQNCLDERRQSSSWMP